MSGRWTLGPWEPSWSRREHADAVQEVRSAIARGDVYQVNVVGHASAEYEGDPSAALAREISVVDFMRGEELRTEVSAKFRKDGVRRELAAAGLALTHWWTDAEGRFALSLSVAR